jgi:hypothetical protein
LKKKKTNKKDKVAAYLDGAGALPATEKEMRKWIKKYLVNIKKVSGA